jgi:hypothetical protein
VGRKKSKGQCRTEHERITRDRDCCRNGQDGEKSMGGLMQVYSRTSNRQTSGTIKEYSVQCQSFLPVTNRLGQTNQKCPRAFPRLHRSN